MTAAEASTNTALRARVVVASGASGRAVADALRGYCLNRGVRSAIYAALAAEGVDVASIPSRPPAEIAAWRMVRQRRGAPRLMPDGYAVEQCDCGREYPRMQSEAVGRCPKIVHKAKCVDREGNVSALCFRKPRVVDYSRENAVIVDANVTCPKCRAILDEKVTPCRP